MKSETDKKILIAADWEYDTDFISFLDASLHEYCVHSAVVRADNLTSVIRDIQSGQLKVLALIDRASDTNSAFIQLQSLLHENGVPIIDPVEQVHWVSDKATMHLEFLAADIPTPYTLILPPYEEKNTPALHVDDLAILGRPFVIKPANTTGGGIGVVDGAESLQEVLHARTEFRSDKYLIQEKIIPIEKEGYRFWFRSFYAGGQIFSAWWHDETHRYMVIDHMLIEPFGLHAISRIMRKIARVAMLTLFSSELVCCADGRWVVVDYVNESCDMRIQSKHWDGVPDNLVKQIAAAIAKHVVCVSRSKIDTLS
ncbi:hypothetical protein JW835_13460 [bacterium]|nr:hypothetical protein [bacterium]